MLVDGVVKPTPEAVEFIAHELARLAGKRRGGRADTGDLMQIAREIDATLARSTDQRRVYDAAAQLDAVALDTARDDAGRVFLGIPTVDNTLEGIRAG